MNPRNILADAIHNSNIELFLEYFTADNITDFILSEIVRKPILHLSFEFIIANNSALCEKISDYSWGMIYHTMSENNMELFNMILKYIPIKKLVAYVLQAGMTVNNLQIIDSVVDHGYDIVSIFKDAIPSQHDIMNDAAYDIEDKVKLDTLLYLAQYGIYIFDYANHLAMMFYHYNDLFGLNYCLESGADANYILCELPYIDINIIQLLLVHGADLNQLKLNQLETITHNKDSLTVMTYLIENGLDISIYLNNLALHAVVYQNVNMITYFINSGADIHFDDNILLFCACKVGEIKIIELLLELGAHHDEILLFIKKDYSKYIYDGLNYGWSPEKICAIVKILFTHNPTIINPSYVFCVYANYTRYNKHIIEELFRIFLDYGIDFNFKYKSLYILEFLSCRGMYQSIKICLEYGADPYINNYGPLRQSLFGNKIKTSTALLKLGSIVDPDWCFCVKEKIINLLAKLHIAHNLKKLIIKVH
jgi:hypothetical protein